VGPCRYRIEEQGKEPHGWQPVGPNRARTARKRARDEPVSKTIRAVGNPLGASPIRFASKSTCRFVDLDAGPAAKLVLSEPGSPIGEIGFLRGSSATATVTARTPTCALVIDDDMLARLEREQPAVNADLLRRLAETAQERTSFNLTWSTSAAAYLR
jgi:hypothetical protein